MDREYILTEIERKSGKLNGSIIYVFHLIDTETLEKYESVIDTSYRNYTRCGWDQIINSQSPLGIYKGLRITTAKTNKGKKVINADSYPIQVASATMDQIIEIVQEITRMKAKKEVRQEVRNEMFDKLFDLQ